MRDAFERFLRKVDMAKKRIFKLKNKSIEAFQSETHRGKLNGGRSGSRRISQTVV
jgi:hypothetical protein